MNTVSKSLLIGLLGLTPLVMHAGTLTGNLLTNPGAETGNLTGWTAGGNTGVGVDSGTFDPGINPHTGSYDFYGGVGGGNPLGSLSQTVSIVTGGVTTSLINTGDLTADVSYWEQSLDQGAPSDEAYIQLTFLNASDGVISTVDMPGVYSIGSWTNYTEDFAIPAGTQSIDYSMEFQLEKGINIDSFVDDNSLTVDGPSTSPVPEPSTLVTEILGICALGAGLLLQGWRKGRLA
jgi:hypothetical protein